MTKIQCLTDGCIEIFIKMCGRHLYCKKCQLDRKRKQCRDWLREQTRKNPIIGVETKCVVKGCLLTFIKNSPAHLFCARCAPKQRALRSTEHYRRKRKTNPDGVKRYARERRRNDSARIKIEVLSHYGKDGCLLCCWPDCNVADVDMLSLDHINDDGKAERDAGIRGGVEGYRRIKSQGFPKKYQTLCYNHQFKKEMLRKRRNRIQ